MPDDLIPQDTEKLQEQEEDLFESFLPFTWIHHYHDIPPEYYLLPDDELDKLAHKTPHEKDTDEDLREKFWDEHEYAVKHNRRILSTDVYSKIVSRFTWNRIVSNPARLAWILRPLGDYVATNNRALRLATKRCLEILNLPLELKRCRCHYGCICYKGRGYTSNCKCKHGCICPPSYNTKLADTINKIRESMELRSKGSIPQVQKIMSMNLHQHQQIAAPEAKLPDDPELIQQRLNELRIMQKEEALPQASAATQDIITVEIIPTETKEK